MAWLGSRLVKRPPNGQEPEPDPELVAEEEQEAAPAGPPLVLLVPDAGVSSFRLHSFASAPAAAEFAASSLASSAVPGIHAFWALHQPPTEPGDQSRRGEAMVLIRSAEQSDAVYMVSFVDIDSALSFVRFEAKRGLNLGLVTVYWADLVQMRCDDSGVRITPESPPLEVRQLEPDLPPAELQTAIETDPSQAQPLMVPPVQTPRSELQVEAEEARATERRDAAEAAGMLIDAAPPVGAEQTAGPVAHLLDAELAAQQQAAAAEAADVAEVVDVAEPAPDAESAALEAVDGPEAPAEPALETEPPSLDADGGELHASDLEIAAAEDLFQPEQPRSDAPTDDGPPEAEEYAGELLDAGEGSGGMIAEPEMATPVEEPVVEPAPDDDELEQEDIVSEVEKILRVKRWDKRNKPFRGFGSPPGRF